MSPRLTIVVPLKARYPFTLRFLFHANRVRLPHRILLADGQVHPALSGMLDNAHRHFPNLDLEYVRYPDDRNFSQFFAKMRDAVSRVRTPYALLADNDDFIAAAGTEKALDFLEANPDFSCCAGRMVGFALYSGPSNPGNGLTGRLNRLYKYYPDVDLPEPSVRDRLNKGGRVLWPYYAVTRTEALARTCAEIAEIDFTDLQLHESYHVMRMLTLGKAKLDASMTSYFRQFGTSLVLSRKKDWVHHLIHSRFTVDLDAFIARIAEAAASQGADATAVADDVRAILEARFRQIVQANYGSLQELKQSLRARMPEAITWYRNRPRWFMGREQSTLFRILSQGGASAPYLETLRGEIAAFMEVCSGRDFAEFAAACLPAFETPEEPVRRQAVAGQAT